MKTLICLTLLLCLSAPAYCQGPPQLYAGDGRYLGNVTNNPLDPNGINNPLGVHGNPLMPNSIHNELGIYGNPLSPLSPGYGRTGIPQPATEPIYGDDD